MLNLFKNSLTEVQIKFCATEQKMADVWPNPKPASHFVPKEYKDLPRFNDKNLHSPTVKTCIPFLDSMTAGYIIPFDQDYVIDQGGDDFSLIPADHSQDNIDYHNKAQLPKAWHKHSGAMAGKFINKWLIRTPPGYSCLFVQPMNRPTDRIKIIEGVVDTDKYINVINFPYILLKKDEQFMLKKGDPMVQVIPFRREKYKMWSGFYFEKDHAKVQAKLSKKWMDKYKSMFWSKKSYK